MSWRCHTRYRIGTKISALPGNRPADVHFEIQVRCRYSAAGYMRLINFLLEIRTILGFRHPRLAISTEL